MTKTLLTSCALSAVTLCSIPAAAQSPKLYNTAKQKLLEGKQIFSYTQSKVDIAGHCEAAKHYDYTWFEMQHSTIEFKDVEAMIAGCPHAGAIPMIRLPDAQEWHIQHATDIGALGVVIPTVDDVDRPREAVNGSDIRLWRGAAPEPDRPRLSGASTASTTGRRSTTICWW